MDSEIRNILVLLNSTFEKNAWHGPSVKEVLQNINPQQSLKRLNNTHSIIELVSHMTAWKLFVISRLLGDNEYTVNDQLNFPSETDWEKALKDLYDTQARLVELLETFPETRLADVVPHGSFSYTYYHLLHGIIHHDLYHAGQIALIKKTL
jgi:uncharacterized damage-inducible protein DinB